MRKQDLEERLIIFGVANIDIVGNMIESKAANHMAGQLLRSGTSPALNYGEAQSGESRKDFIHKLKIVLKELRETYVALRMIQLAKLNKGEENVKRALVEANELIAIFVKSIETAQKNGQ